MSSYLVVGLGRFGKSVAKALYRNGKTVLALDRDEESVQQAIEYQIVDEAIILDVTDENSLKKIVDDNFDTAIVCIGSDMQSSILATLLLKEIGVKNIICKAANRIQGKVLEKVGATQVVYPEETMGEKIAMKVIQPDITEHFKFSDEYGMFEFEAPRQLVGKNLIELNLRKKYDMNIIGIRKPGQESTMNPDPDTVIEEGSVLFSISRIDRIEQFYKLFEAKK